METRRLGIVWAAAGALALLIGLAGAGIAQEELIIEDEGIVAEEAAPAEAIEAPGEAEAAEPVQAQPAQAAKPAAAKPEPVQAKPAEVKPAPAAPAAAKPAPVQPATPAGGGAISSITVAPTPDGGQIDVVMKGSGPLSPKIMKLGREKMGNLKLVLDFSGVRYQTAQVALGAPGLGDIKVVRGAQFKAVPEPVARVVIELKRMVPYEEVPGDGIYTIRISTAAVAEAEAEAVESAEPAPAVSQPAAAPKPAAPPVAESVPLAIRSRILHAMVTDLPDRVRLVVTADGVFKYKLASKQEGKALELALYDVDLKWSPPRLSLKTGPIRNVIAKQITSPSRQVIMTVNLQRPRPYHVRRDQNQVIIEVEKDEEDEKVDEEVTRGGDILHRVTINVQNEDLASLVKALAFEAGFDNVRVNDSVIQASRKITMSLRGVRLGRALNLILGPYDFVWTIEQGVLRVGRSDEFDKELEATAMSGASGGSGDGGIVTKVFRLKHISVFDILGGGAESGIMIPNPYLMAPPYIKTEIVKAVSDILVSKTKGKVTVDARTNSLIVTDAASNMSKIEKLIRDLDIPIPQVNIQAKLIQVQRSGDDKLGIVWEAARDNPSNPELRAVAEPLNKVSGSAFYLTTGILAPGVNLEATLSVMQERGESKVLMSPSITTIHDRAARVMTERRVYYMTSTILPSDGGPIVQTTFSPIGVPIELMVRPHVNPDNTIVMEVDIGMSNIVPGAMANAPPNISSQSATTRLMIRSGETGVIGGMLTDEMVKTTSKVPVLGSLPWWLGGGLFRAENMTSEKMELILFLTPTISDRI